MEHGELLPAPPCIVVVGQLRGRQRAGPYEKGSREVASGSGLRGGGIPESSADRKDARISEIGGRGRDEEQARLPAARRPETMRCRGRTRSVERGQKPCWSALLVFTMDGRSNGLGF